MKLTLKDRQTLKVTWEDCREFRDKDAEPRTVCYRDGRCEFPMDGMNVRKLRGDCWGQGGDGGKHLDGPSGKS